MVGKLNVFLNLLELGFDLGVGRFILDKFGKVGGFLRWDSFIFLLENFVCFDSGLKFIEFLFGELNGIWL